MRARTFGPITLMTLGAAMAVVPATGWEGAGVIGPSTTTPVTFTIPTTVAPAPTTTVAAATTTITVAATTTVAAATTVVSATTVAAPATTTALGSGGQSLELPALGIGSSSTVLLGGLLMLVGGALLVTGRRPRRNPQR